MKELKFKTSIDCGGCVNAVTPFLNKVENIKNWKADTLHPDKILTVETDGTEEEIVNAVKKAGFNIEAVAN
ncbi:MAG: cation transporter [Prevotellaceae bacterium]|jgi:copper chaperone|nr:cation transporter [Prevotellaceae bacterium]